MYLHRSILRSCWKRSQGQGLAEYGLILVLAVILVAGVLALFGPQIAGLFSQASSQLP